MRLSVIFIAVPEVCDVAVLLRFRDREFGDAGRNEIFGLCIRDLGRIDKIA